MIRDLAPAYLARLASPSGVGDLEPADLAGEVGSVVGGSGVRVTLRLSKPDGLPRRIASARFRPFGSAAPLAPGSVLVERLVGLGPREAAATRPSDLLEPLGPSLPDAVRRAADHLVAALGRALSDGEAAAARRSPGVLVCRCLGVGDRVVRRAVRAGARDVPAIGRDCAAGTGCHSCWPDLRVVLDEERHRDERPPAPPEADRVRAAVEAVVRPLWRAQGLTLGEAVVDGDTVLLSVAETAADALASPIGAIALARHALRETLAEGVRVEGAPGLGREAHARTPGAR